MMSKTEVLLLLMCLSTLSAESPESIESNDLNPIIENDLKPTTEQNEFVFRNLVRPFRMNELNLIWVKAQHVSVFLFLFSNILFYFSFDKFLVIEQYFHFR